MYRPEKGEFCWRVVDGERVEPFKPTRIEEWDYGRKWTRHRKLYIEETDRLRCSRAPDIYKTEEEARASLERRKEYEPRAGKSKATAKRR